MKLVMEIKVAEKDWADSDGKLWIEKTTVFRSGTVLIQTFGPIDLNKHLIMKTSESPFRIIGKGSIPVTQVEREATIEEMSLFEK